MIAVGQILQGRYALTRQLGEGGMAQVYLADDQTLGRQVAIKTLHADLNDNVEVSARFLREARIFASLKHPHIVDIYDVLDLGEGRAAMVMEFIDGTDLSAVLGEGARLVPELAVLLLRPIADALSYAHGRGVIHRDVKPANVLLGRDGAIKLSDFGIAKATEQTHITRTGDFLGTPAYIAPEQARGEAIGPAADQFALGVMLYEMVTGRRPFDASTPVAILSKVLIGHYEDPRTLSKAVDERLATVINTALADKPEKRFASLSALLDALRSERPIDVARLRAIISDLVVQPAQTVKAMAQEAARTYVGMGRAAMRSERTAEARGAALKALARDPDDADAQEILALTPVPGAVVAPAVAPKNFAFAETAEAPRAAYDIPSTPAPAPPAGLAVDGRADTADHGDDASQAIRAFRQRSLNQPAPRNGRWVVLLAICIAALIGGGVTWLLRTQPPGSDARVVVQPSTPASIPPQVPDSQAVSVTPGAAGAPSTTAVAPTTATPATTAPATTAAIAPATTAPAPRAPKARRPATRPRRKSVRSTPPATPKTAAPQTAPSAATATRQPGRLVVRVTPWGDLSVDGVARSKGKLTHPTLTLAPGEHTIEVRHPKWGTRRQTVQISAGKTTTVKLSLR